MTREKGRTAEDVGCDADEVQAVCDEAPLDDVRPDYKTSAEAALVRLRDDAMRTLTAEADNAALLSLVRRAIYGKADGSCTGCGRKGGCTGDCVMARTATEHHPGTALLEELAALRERVAALEKQRDMWANDAAALYDTAVFIGPCAHGRDPWDRCDECGEGTAVHALVKVNNALREREAVDRAEAAESALNDIAEVLFGERPHGVMPSTTLDAVKALYSEFHSIVEIGENLARGFSTSIAWDALGRLPATSHPAARLLGMVRETCRMLVSVDEGYNHYKFTALRAEGEVNDLLAMIERLKQERADALSVKTKEGLTASEWLLRTGKAEREAAACRSYLEGTREALGGNADDDVEALAMVRMSELEQAQTDRDFYKAAAASSFQGAVKAFHEAMGLPVESVPTMPYAKARALRCRLLLEEALEFCTASGLRVYSPGGVLLGKGDFVFEEDENHPADLATMAHENADVLYIAFGTYVTMGVIGAAVFGEVHAANMRKLGPDGRPILNAAGKVLKPEGWKPADVALVLAKMGGRNE